MTGQLLRQLVEMPGRVGLRPQDRRKPLGCHRFQYAVVQDPGRVHHGGEAGSELLDHGGQLALYGGVAGHQVHLCARPLEVGPQRLRARRVRSAPAGEHEMPDPVPGDEMAGQQCAQGPGAPGDQDGAPAGERSPVGPDWAVSRGTVREPSRMDSWGSPVATAAGSSRSDSGRPSTSTRMRRPGYSA